MKHKTLILKLCLASLALLGTHALQAQTASDNYLDLANYATINEAGWNTSVVKNLYKYTTYPVDSEQPTYAWLTMPVYGAWSTVKYNSGSQHWITSTTGSSSASGIGDWKTPIFPAWGFLDKYYFGNLTSKPFGPTTQGRSPYEVTFYVTNITDVNLFGNTNTTISSGTFSNPDKYSTTLTVYECTLENGTPTHGVLPYGIAKCSTSSTKFSLTVSDLDESKIYKVEAKLYSGALFEIGFKTLLNQPNLRAFRSQQSFLAAPGTDKTKTVKVKGRQLSGDVTVTLTDPDNVFSVSTNQISQADAEAGYNVGVTFHSVTAGSYTGTLTFTCGDLSATVSLSAEARTLHTAIDPYLDIANYTTIDDAGWNHTYVNKLYEFTNNYDDNEAWLTMPVYGAWMVIHDNHPQKWISSEISSTIKINEDGYITNQTWNETSHFKGSSTYFNKSFGDGRPRVFGHDVVTLHTIYFYVTNLKAVEVLGYNFNTNSPAALNVYECALLDEQTLQPASSPIKSATNGTANTSFTLAVDNLDPSKIYMVEAIVYRGYLSEIAFCTPIPDVIEKKTLAQLVENGVNNKLYQVTDDNLTCVDYAIDDNSIKIFAKDDRGYANPDENITNAIDYMGSIAGFGSANNYDQSNWVVIELNNITSTGQITNPNLNGYTLKDVIGTWYKDENGNCTIVASSVPTQGTASEYTPNIFITCNFLGNLQTGADGNNYYFVMPKPMEIAEITWAQWSASKNAFVIPEQTGNTNQLGLDGGFYINTHFLPAFNPVDGETYNFKALIRKESSASINATNLCSGVTRTIGGSNATVSNDYLAYPLSLVGENGGIITAVTDVRKAEPVGDDRYYNVMGQPVLHPSPGIYIHNGRKVVITQ